MAIIGVDGMPLVKHNGYKRKRNVRNNFTDTIEAEWGCLQIYSKGK
jgi:hypothetical protein